MNDMDGDLANKKKSEEVPAKERADDHVGWRDGVYLANLVAHEFKNDLNNLMLYLAVLEQQRDGADNSKLVPFRQMALKTAALVEKFQRFSHGLHSAPLSLDLNEIVRKTILAYESSQKGTVIKLKLNLDQGMPPVLGTRDDLSRLLELLLADAVGAVSPDSGSVSVITGVQKQIPFLRVVDSGPPVPPNLLPQLFDPFVVCRRGGNGVRLAVSEAIARRLGGHIRAENASDDGLAITVQLPAAGDPSESKSK